MRDVSVLASPHRMLTSWLRLWLQPLPSLEVAVQQTRRTPFSVFDFGVVVVAEAFAVGHMFRALNFKCPSETDEEDSVQCLRFRGGSSSGGVCGGSDVPSFEF